MNKINNGIYMVRWNLSHYRTVIESWWLSGCITTYGWFTRDNW